MPRARIICTLGPSSGDAKTLEAMIAAGMDVARFNFSHGTHDDHRRRADLLRKLSKKTGRPVAILQDVQGPKIRLGSFVGGQLHVNDGELVTVTTKKVLGGKGVLPTPVLTLPQDVRKGDPILLDDGRVRLEVLSVRGTDVRARVIVGGLLKDKKGLNLPGAAMSVQTLTPKDTEDIIFGRELGVDYVALSFVRSASDIHHARKLVAEGTPIIAKIEKPQAVEALESISDASDGIMVARGDLGVELPLEQLPAIQKRAIRVTNASGGLVIVATEMLESMIHNPRPTRAEVSDVANAILDGADAVMLSGETASGQYPVEAVRTMAKVIEETERGHVSAGWRPTELTDDISTGVAAAAVAASEQMNAPLVAYTESGLTARLISELRPRAKIVGLTPNPSIVRRMKLYWGVHGLEVARVMSTDSMLKQVRKTCGKLGLTGGPVVIVAGIPLNQPGNTNLMTIRRFD